MRKEGELTLLPQAFEIVRRTIFEEGWYFVGMWMIVWPAPGRLWRLSWLLCLLLETLSFVDCSRLEVGFQLIITFQLREKMVLDRRRSKVPGIGSSGVMPVETDVNFSPGRGAPQTPNCAIPLLFLLSPFSSYEVRVPFKKLFEFVLLSFDVRIFEPLDQTRSSKCSWRKCGRTCRMASWHHPCCSRLQHFVEAFTGKERINHLHRTGC
jgi:hypothetical protein